MLKDYKLNNICRELAKNRSIILNSVETTSLYSGETAISQMVGFRHACESNVDEIALRGNNNQLSIVYMGSINLSQSRISEIVLIEDTQRRIVITKDIPGEGNIIHIKDKRLLEEAINILEKKAFLITQNRDWYDSGDTKISYYPRENDSFPLLQSFLEYLVEK